MSALRIFALSLLILLLLSPLHGSGAVLDDDEEPDVEEESLPSKFKAPAFVRGQITQLNEDNYLHFISQPFAVLLVHKDDEISKRILANFTAAAEALRDESPAVPIGALNIHDVAPKHDIRKRFPLETDSAVIKVVRFGKAFDYKGILEIADILDYLRLQRGPSWQTFSTYEAVEDAAKVGVLVLGFFAEKSRASSLHHPSAGLQASFNHLAHSFRHEWPFAKVINNTALMTKYIAAAKEAAEEERIQTGAPARRDSTSSKLKKVKESIFIIAQGRPVRYSGKNNVDDIYKFLRSNSIPLVGPINASTSSLYISRGIPLVTLFIGPRLLRNNTDNTIIHTNLEQDYIIPLRKLARHFRDKLAFTYAVIGTGTEWEQKKLIFNLLNTTVVLSVEDWIQHKRWRYMAPSPSLETVINDKSMREWLKGIVDGTTKEWKKTERKPTVEVVDGMTIAVGETLPAILNDKSSDILLDFYAPWCTHCKAIEPALANVKKHFTVQQGANALRLVKFNAVDNDFDHKVFNVTRYPALFFRAANSPKVLLSPATNEAELIDWIKVHGATVVGQKAKQGPPQASAQKPATSSTTNTKSTSKTKSGGIDNEDALKKLLMDQLNQKKDDL